MKLVFLLLVCVASTYAAQVGPLNNVVGQVEQHLQNVLQTYKQQLLNLIQSQRPQFESALNIVNEFISKLPVLQQVYVQKIKDTLVQFVQSVMNGQARSLNLNELKQQLTQKIQSLLQELASHLQTLALNVVSQVHAGKRNLDVLSLVNQLSNLNVNDLVNQFAPQITNVVNSVVGQLLGNLFGKRDLVNLVANTLGLGQIWDAVQQAGTVAVTQFTQAAGQLLFAGQAVWAEAQKILNQMVSDVTSHLGNSSAIIQAAAQQLSGLLAQQGKRGVGDFLANTLGLSQVWDQISSVGSTLMGQFVSVGTQLLFAGQNLLNNAKPILSQLVSDLTNHVGNAAPLVQGAVAQLTALLAQQGKRGVQDVIVNALGLNQVWSQIQGLGSNVIGQVTAVGTQLLFAGQNLLNQAKPILSQLVSDLTNHVGNAAPLVQGAVAQLTSLLASAGKRDLSSFFLNTLGLNQVASELQNVGQNAVGQLVSMGTQLFLQGQQVWAQANTIFQQLVKDLLAHTGNASQIVQAATSQLAGLLNQAGKRGLQDVIVNTLGLNQVWSQIQGLGSNVISQVTAVGTQLLFAGQNLLNQAKPILSQLVSDLTNHVGNAAPLVQGAVAQLTSLLASAGKRDLAGTILNTLGLNQVISELQNAGQNVQNQLVGMATQLFFQGQQVWGQAVTIFQQLVKDLLAHTGNASQIVQAATSQLAALLSQSAGKRGLQDVILNTLGLNSVITELQNAGQNVVSQLMGVGAQLLFAGKDLLAQAQGILSQLVQDLKDHIGNGTPYIQQAVNALVQLLQQNNGKRDLSSFIGQTLGLGSVWDEIVGLGQNVLGQVISVGTQLLFQGQAVLAEAKKIFAQLVSDLQNHVGNALPLVQGALSQVTGIIASQGKRDVTDFLLNSLGLGSIVSQLQAAGSNLYQQYLNVATQLIFQGQQALSQAKVIIVQLINDLKGHANQAVPLFQQALQQLTAVVSSQGKRDVTDFFLNTLGLGQINAQLQAVGSQLYGQLTGVLAQLLFQGQQVLGQGKEIIKQLIKDVIEHANNATPFVQNAVQQLTQLIGNNGK